MQSLLLIILSIIQSTLWGVFLYVIGTYVIPDKHSTKFFEIVPLYPKPKYAILLYLISGILFYFMASELFGTAIFETKSIIICGPFCLIVSSQIVRSIAHIRKENIEETIEEEIERKRNQ